MILNHRLVPAYKLLKYSAGGLLLEETPWTNNILTDTGFENWVGGSSTGTETFMSYCAVGNGTGVPTAGDSTITQVGARFQKVSGVDDLEVVTAVGNVLTCTTAYITAVATSSYSVSEVGIFNASAGGILMSRALIKDVTGTPTSITVNPGEYLKVLYKVQVTVDLGDKTGSFVWNSVTYNYTARPMAWNTGLSVSPKTTNNFWVWPKGVTSDAPSNGFGLNRAVAHENQTLTAVTARPTYSTGSVAGSRSLVAYTANSKARKVEYIFGASEGNISGGIGGVLLETTGILQSGYQISFSPKIPKVSPVTFKVGITHQFSR